MRYSIDGERDDVIRWSGMPSLGAEGDGGPLAATHVVQASEQSVCFFVLYFSLNLHPPLFHILLVYFLKCRFDQNSILNIMPASEAAQFKTKGSSLTTKIL